MIELKNITKEFGGQKVIDNLSFNIKENSIYGLIGANGAGKSTLLRIINGIYQKDSGSILVDGEELEKNSEIKQKIAFLADDLFFCTGYTLEDTKKIYASLYKAFDNAYFDEMVDLLNLDKKKKISEYSKGLKRQCAIICALATNSKYIFLDETFDGLDPVVRNVIKILFIKQMERKNTTFILTSHNLRELEDICDNLSVLYKGKILFGSDVEHIKSNMFKVQISLNGDFNEDTFSMLNVLNYKKTGSVATLIIEDKEKNSKSILESLNPTLLDYLTLTLEEVFICEMEGLGYEFNRDF